MSKINYSNINKYILNPTSYLLIISGASMVLYSFFCDDASREPMFTKGLISCFIGESLRNDVKAERLQDKVRQLEIAQAKKDNLIAEQARKLGSTNN